MQVGNGGLVSIAIGTGDVSILNSTVTNISVRALLRTHAALWLAVPFPCSAAHGRTEYLGAELYRRGALRLSRALLVRH